MLDCYKWENFKLTIFLCVFLCFFVFGQAVVDCRRNSLTHVTNGNSSSSNLSESALSLLYAAFHKDRSVDPTPYGFLGRVNKR
jgi:hypothetical protein